MEKTFLSFGALLAIIVMTILQGCLATADKAGTQCAKPTLVPSDATSATRDVTVKVTTRTAGAYLRYTLDGSIPTGGPAGNGTQIEASSGKIELTLGPRDTTLKAIAYKEGLADSPVAEGTYVYQSPYLN